MIVRRDGQRLRLIFDAVGSVRAVVDADTGAVVQRLAYDAYGQVTQDTAPGTQPFGFKGAISDPVAQGAGLVWMGVRAYLPSLARFTTADPAGLNAAWNQHDALGGDPVNLIDADGRFAFLVLPAAMAVSALASAVAIDAVVHPENWQAVGEAMYGGLNALGNLCTNGIDNAIAIAAGEDALDGDGDPSDDSRPGYLPRDADGNPLPLPAGPDGERLPGSDYPHTQIGTGISRRAGPYPQTREWGNDGELTERTDWTDHGRPNDPGHTDPHSHPWLGEQWGPARPR